MTGGEAGAPGHGQSGGGGLPGAAAGRGWRLPAGAGARRSRAAVPGEVSGPDEHASSLQAALQSRATVSIKPSGSGCWLRPGPGPCRACAAVPGKLETQFDSSAHRSLAQNHNIYRKPSGSSHWLRPAVSCAFGRLPCAQSFARSVLNSVLTASFAGISSPHPEQRKWSKPLLAVAMAAFCESEPRQLCAAVPRCAINRSSDDVALLQAARGFSGISC